MTLNKEFAEQLHALGQVLGITDEAPSPSQANAIIDDQGPAGLGEVRPPAVVAYLIRFEQGDELINCSGKEVDCEVVSAMAERGMSGTNPAWGMNGAFN